MSCGTLLIALPVIAATAESTPLQPAAPATPDLLGLGSSLVAVLLAILLLGWLYKRSAAYGGGRKGVINILAAQSLGPKERILVVDVAGQQLVLGMTATSVQTLHVLSEPVKEAPEARLPTSFAERLRSTLTGAKR